MCSYLDALFSTFHGVLLPHRPRDFWPGHALLRTTSPAMPVNNMPARTFDHKYSAPRSAKSTGELAFKLARDDDKENGVAKGQALSPSKIIKGVRGRAVGTPTSRSVDWPHAVCGHSAASFSSSSGPAPAEFASSLDSLAQIANIQVRRTRSSVAFCHRRPGYVARFPRNARVSSRRGVCTPTPCCTA
jgi:hypothetical protein